MLAYFPKPHADELLYSVLARCSDAVGYSHHRTLIRLLFDDKDAKVRFDLPGRLDRLATVIPRNALGSGADILKKYTLFPLYSPFIDENWKNRLSEAIVFSDSLKSRMVVGLSPLRVGCPRHFRACPHCWREDVQLGKERYWRRSHQAPGVLICHYHGTALEITSVRTLNPPSTQKYVSAERSHRLIRIPISLLNLNRGLLRNIATGSHWLLNLSETEPGPLKLQSAYLAALGNLRLLKGKTVRLNEVTRLVVQHCGQPTLAALSSEIEAGAPHSWITQILRFSKSSRSAQAPLRHLILMATLGRDPKTFFMEAMSAPAAIPEYTSAPAKQAKAPVCNQRHEELSQWWIDPSISVSEMARRMGVATATITLYAAKNGFPFPRRALGSLVGRPILKNGRPRQWRSKAEVRRTFLLLRHEYPSLSQKELLKIDGGTVRWLQKQDLAWLRQNRQPSIRKGGNPGINWARRDAECAGTIPTVARRLIEQKVKLSISALARELGWSVGNTYKNMPKTQAALTEALRSIPSVPKR